MLLDYYQVCAEVEEQTVCRHSKYIIFVRLNAKQILIEAEYFSF